MVLMAIPRPPEQAQAAQVTVDLTRSGQHDSAATAPGQIGRPGLRQYISKTEGNPWHQSLGLQRACHRHASPSADGTQPAISFTASLKMTKAGTDATANGEIPLMFYASDTESQEIRGKQRTGSRDPLAQPDARGKSRSCRYQPPDAGCASRPCRSGAPRDGMEWSGSGRTRPLSS